MSFLNNEAKPNQKNDPIMKKNSEQEPEPGVETDYSAGAEAKEMGAFVEDARESVRYVGHTVTFGSTGTGKSVSIAELLKNPGQVAPPV
jgi:Holliday junction resolvasome RuvABC ATP-dependent DNA helicase subunit